ncbi:PRTRC system ThiF family protein [Tunicatimonas pelagia]|uniref:PRTRC system ThiF family protein n=1 Tax=Tunicatimonas pelagia TaxID=931531 RepID=UPI0026664FB1|nr:PRTRC system ThiF family protein [Tunicatimonas pelagia]WKN46449.1 PRTRC system ThiF family protein [Tunicatimonas pelagia]
MIHFLPQCLQENREPISVALIGAGGTGSQLLTHLARIHLSLQALGRQGLRVIVYDPDTVTEANIARQLFSFQDEGGNKAVTLVSRINRFFGSDWLAVPAKFHRGNAERCNVYLTCVDSVKARKQCYSVMKKLVTNYESSHQSFYWLDTGNMRDFGQVVLSSLTKITQPDSQYETLSRLPNVLQLFPGMVEEADLDNEPSCSLAEAIGKQDLFINTAIAMQAGQLLWQLLKEGYTTSQGSFVNLKTGKTNALPLRSAKLRPTKTLLAKAS